MITVGTAYMSVPEAPVKEIMKDMIEMCRGVQHPVRGLFLRYYLSQTGRDNLPIGSSEGPEGNLQDSIQFIVTNFIEMNKLWVRLQHQGHSREREKRTKERKELQILVGSNLVRLSQLEGIDKEYYRTTILPAILEQVVQCRDAIAQEYLLDVVSQVFPDEFHLYTLDIFLNATSNLHPQSSVKKVVLALVNRLADYATREAENESSESNDNPLADALEKTAIDDSKKEDESTAKDPKDDDKKEEEEDSKNEGDNESKPSSVEVVRGVPTNIDLFDIFWSFLLKLLEVRPDLPFEDISALLVGIVRLSLSCYPDRYENVDKLLGFVLEKVEQLKDTTEAHSSETITNILELLKLLIRSFPRILTVLRLKNFIPLLVSQPSQTQKAVASSVAHDILKGGNQISTVEEVEGVFGLVRIVIREGVSSQKRGVTSGFGSDNLAGLMGDTATGTAEDDKDISDEVLTDQGNLTKIVHLIYNKDPTIHAKLLTESRKALSEGGHFIRYTYPALVTNALRLIRRIKARENVDKDGWAEKISTNFTFIQQVINEIYRVSAGDKALRLYVSSASVADQVGSEEAAYEYFAQAFTIYEEALSDSRAQYQAVMLIAGALQSTRHFTPDSYDTLVSKCALYGSKLLKKPDQCRAVYLASHLWWAVEIPALGEQEESTEFFRDGSRVLECLQRSLRVADACMDVAVSVELFVEILNRYLYFFDRGNEKVTVDYIIGLIDLIQRNLTSMTTGEGNVSDSPRKHFERTLQYINEQKEYDERFQKIVW